jgi:hypothetical protein
MNKEYIAIIELIMTNCKHEDNCPICLAAINAISKLIDARFM